MEQTKQERLKISNDLLDNLLVGVKTQEDLWGNDGIITQLNKAILERILNAEMAMDIVKRKYLGHSAKSSWKHHGTGKVLLNRKLFLNVPQNSA